MDKKIQTTKSIRVWILGAAVCATIFFALSAKFDTWGMKTYIDRSTNEENTTFIGLWNKCLQQRQGNNATQPKFPMTEICEKYGKGSLANIDGVPDFIRAVRIFLTLIIVTMGLTSVITFWVMLLTEKPLIYIAAPPALIATLGGIAILISFLAPLGHNDNYKDYTPAWAFYYFLIGWFFTMSTFCAALTDRARYQVFYA